MLFILSVSEYATLRSIFVNCLFIYLFFLLKLHLESSYRKALKQAANVCFATVSVNLEFLFFSTLSHNFASDNPFPSGPVLTCSGFAGKLYLCPFFNVAFSALFSSIFSSIFSFTDPCRKCVVLPIPNIPYHIRSYE